VNILTYILYRCLYITSTQEPVLPWRYDVEMGTANSLHASA